MRIINRIMLPTAALCQALTLLATAAPPTEPAKPPATPPPAPAAVAPVATPPAATPPATTAPSAGVETGTPPIAFETDFDTALARAKKENKLLLVEFMTPTCGYCAKMMKNVYPKPETKQFASQLVWARIDQTQGAGLRLMNSFNGGATPMYVAVGYDGTSVFYKQTGALNVTGFLHNMSILNYSNDEYLKAAKAAHDHKMTPAELLARAKGHLVQGQLSEGKADLEKIVADDPTNESGLADDALIFLGQIDLASSPVFGNNLAIGRWMELIKKYPTADHAPDAVWYLAKAFRATHRTDLLAKMSPFLKSYPDSVDVSACYKAIQEPPETQ